MLTIRITDGRKTMVRDFLPTSAFTGDIFAGIGDPWTDTTTPRTDRPVRFRRVAIRKRDAWGMGWDHYSKSETFRYGY